MKKRFPVSKGSIIALFCSFLGCISAIGILYLIFPGGKNESVFDIIMSVFAESVPTLFVSLISLLFFSLYFGKAGEKSIIKYNENPEDTGVKVAFFSVFSSILLTASFYMFFIVGRIETNAINFIFDNLLNPLIAVLIFGFIPIICLGIIYGYLMKKLLTRFPDPV